MRCLLLACFASAALMQWLAPAQVTCPGPQHTTLELRATAAADDREPLPSLEFEDAPRAAEWATALKIAGARKETTAAIREGIAIVHAGSDPFQAHVVLRHTQLDWSPVEEGDGEGVVLPLSARGAERGCCSKLRGSSPAVVALEVRGTRALGRS